MNIGKSGVSFSLGKRGLWTTVGRNGIRQSLSLPGTGFCHTFVHKFKRGRQQKTGSMTSKQYRWGMWTRLLMSTEERIFTAGIEYLLAGDKSMALNMFNQISTVVDASFIILVLQFNNLNHNACMEAVRNIEKDVGALGNLFTKYDFELDLEVQITPLLKVVARPCNTMLKLLQARILHLCARTVDACNLLLDLYKDNAQNDVVRIALLDLVLSSTSDKKWLEFLLSITEKVTNGTLEGALLLYYRARVMLQLKRYREAMFALSMADYKSKLLTPEIKLAILKVRANLFDLMGDCKRSQALWKRILISNPTDEQACSKVIF